VKPVTLVIESNSSLKKVDQLLVEHGVIEDKKFLLWTAFSIGKLVFSPSKMIKAGEWKFQSGISMSEAIEHMSDGLPVLHRITFPEGWTSDQIANRLNNSSLLRGDRVLPPAEGVLMPDTYSFVLGQTKQQILTEMAVAMEETLQEIWEGRDIDLPISNKKELLVLASIVEKEVRRPEEARRVAAVFINRIRRGMRLEACPTVIYAIHKGDSWLKERVLTNEDISFSSSYNTYKVYGLPPGPICHPGRASMEAVAHPMKTDELFFVANGKGGHVFSKTFQEHRRNILKFAGV